MASPLLTDGTAVYTPGISERTGSTTTYYHMDAQGSVVATTNGSQTQTGDMRYDGFGQKSYYANSVTTFGWNAKSQYRTDVESGLMLLGHRYYDSATGRFISQDPDQDGWNWYAYCGNNPLGGVDPDGTTPVLAAAAAVAWAAYELGSAIVDTVTAAKTVSDDKATNADKAIAVGGAAAGLLLPGGGYGTAGKAAKGAVEAGQEAAHAAQAASEAKAVAGKITGFTKHGLDRAIGKDGHGVATHAILDAVRNPTKVIQQAGGKTQYVGKKATVILNKDGKVITTWATSKTGYRQ